MLNELKLNIFCTLAETLNFTETAKKMFVSQQTVSRLISELEDEVGLVLFERTSRKVSLTQAGANYYKVVVDMIWSYNRLLADIKAGVNGSQRLSINVQLNLDIGREPHIAMSTLRKNYSVISTESLRISPSRLLQQLDAHKCDIVIMLDRFFSPASRFVTQPLFSTEYLILASPDMIPNGTDSFESLRSLPLLYDALESESPASFEARCKREIHELGLTPSEILWMPNTDSAYSRAEVSDGIVITSSADRVGFGRRLIGFPTGKIHHVLAICREDETNVLVKPYIRMLSDAYKARQFNFNPKEEPLAFYDEEDTPYRLI